VTPPLRASRRAGSGAAPVEASTADASTPPTPALTLDALGKKCPIPIIMLADRIREVRIGQLIEVLADDPAAKTDLPAWCALKSQEFVQATSLPVGWSFLVRRSY
jgi:tRNA 2-thiouridine synthesizing protein A